METRLEYPLLTKNKDLSFLNLVSIFFLAGYIIIKTEIFLLFEGGINADWKEIFVFCSETFFGQEFILAFFTALYVYFTYLLFLSNKKLIELNKESVSKEK